MSIGFFKGELLAKSPVIFKYRLVSQVMQH